MSIEPFLNNEKALRGMKPELALVLIDRLGGATVLDEIVSANQMPNILNISEIKGFDDYADFAPFYQDNKDLFLNFLDNKHDVINNYCQSVAQYVLTRWQATRIKRNQETGVELGMSLVLKALYDPSIKAKIFSPNIELEPIVIVCRDCLLFLLHSYRYYKQDINPIEMVDIYFHLHQSKLFLVLLKMLMYFVMLLNHQFL